MTSSHCRRLARQLLGPLARVETRDGVVLIYVPSPGVRTVYGRGDTYLAALNDCFVLETEGVGALEKSGVLGPPESDSHGASGT